MLKTVLFISLSLLVSCSSLTKFTDTIWGGEKSNQKSKSIVTKTPSKEKEIAVPVLQEEKKLPINSVKILKYCEKIDRKFKKYKWGESRCKEFKWHHVRNSVLGDPLIWLSWGDEKEHKNNPKNMTMLFCGVHGDEITPIKFCFDAILMVEKFAPEYFKDRMLVIAPVVNPDSFFKRRPTRTNHRKVDINRNFPTQDWSAKALKMWKNRYSSDKRRFPGKHALSEPEVLFQMNLIKRYGPDKLVSVHAPLTMWDYDGPEDMKKTVQEAFAFREYAAKSLLMSLSKRSKNYRIKDYPFFPGSLGNWAGNERNIPTYTLELPTSDYTKTDDYWTLFKGAMVSAFTRDIRDVKRSVVMGRKNTTKEIGQPKKSSN